MGFISPIGQPKVALFDVAVAGPQSYTRCPAAESSHQNLEYGVLKDLDIDYVSIYIYTYSNVERQN